MFRLERAAAASWEASERALGGHPLRLIGFAALAVLAERDRITQSALGERIGLDRTSTSELIADLEEEGLARREPDLADRRRNAVRITDAGGRAAESASAALRAAEEALLAPLLDYERDELRGWLRRLEPPPYALGDIRSATWTETTPDDL